MLLNCLCVGIGGGLGSLARYLISQISFLNKSLLPFQTLLVNILGSFLIGIIIGMTERSENMNQSLILFLKVGVCGGFTTFSTFSAESLAFFNNGQALLGIGYVLLSVISCILGVFLGKLTVLNIMK